MAIITINGTLILDQSSGLTDNDTAITNTLSGLSSAFQTFLNGLAGDLALSAAQLAYADDVEAAKSAANLVTVNPEGATISKLSFSDPSGAPLDGDQVIFNGSPLQTVDGDAIYLHSYANGTIVLATTSATEGVGDVVAAFYLNAAGDKLSASVEMVTFEAIAHPNTANPDDQIDWTDLLNVSASGSTSFNFDNLDSGNHLFVAVGTSGAGLVVSGIHPVIKADGTLDNSGDNIKTSQGGIGATIGVNNQMFDPGETAVFSFVKGQAPGTYGDIDNMSYTDFIDVTDAKLFISQTEGSPGTNFTVKIGAFSAGGATTSPEQGRSYIDNNLASGANLGNDANQSALADDAAVAIVRVVIRDGNGQLVTDTTLSNSFVTFNVDGTITAQHLNDAYTVQWFTDNSSTQAVETFNRFQATAVVGKFDVGRVDLSQGVTVTQSVGDKLFTDDDGPSISTTGTEPTLTVDETVLATNATASFVANFSSAYGTDGAGTLTYALGITAGVTGIVDTATNEAVVLSVNGAGVVEGRTATTNLLVFTVSVSATGSVTLDQIRAVVHPNANDPDDSKTLAADNMVKLTATITDKDGDHLSATLNIGQNLVFKDDGPSISTTGVEPTLTVDETVLATNATASFAANFSSAFGADGAGTLTYALGITAGSTGIVDTATGEAVVLSLNGGVVEGRTATTNVLVFTVSVSAAGAVTLDQIRAVVHPNANDPDDSKSLSADNLVQLTATITDKDGDHQSATLNIGQNLIFKDDGPTISTTGVEPTLTVDETVLGPDATQSFTTNFSSAFGADGAGTITYALGFNAGATGLVDTLTGEAVVLSLNGFVLEGRTATTNVLVFTVSVNAAGAVTLDQIRAVVHPDANDPDDSKTLSADNLVQLTATITDKDGDHQSATLNIGTNLVFKDDGPTITKQFDGDQDNLSGIPPIGTHESLTNVNPSSATGDFGYNIGSDQFAVYDATHSDFVDQTGLAGIQLSLGGNLTGLVPAPGTTAFISSFATLQTESATSASFNWQISYDSDPNTAGDQTATAGGTLVFNKVADTYTITLNDAAEGFTKDILHTSELISKEPTSNTGHPNIVVEKLFDASTTPETTDRDFFVQFTANSTTNTIKFGLNTTGDSDGGTPADTAWNPGDLVTNNHEDWVSATKSTNGVAGDTIQKGELLTLRFFDHSPTILNEDITPNQTANDMAIKFDGIGNSEDLMVILDLVSADGTQHTSKAVYISNADIFKTGQVPTAYAADFPLDNNDGLVIIERNDYNGAGENWVIEGAQIMQSGNGITGPDSDPILAGLQETPTAIDLNRTTGSGGSSSQTTLVNWDPTDNDVLKIVDIGFTSTQTTTPDAHLDFGVQLHDADGDTTTLQHILVDVV
ncbi:DUF5801 repeats-in-toxin domain-containing protein [Mesorhizobium kowhaii]|uniref:DUF5801 domain-containing protein n=1 Tax=Mesorhizobium kowhaii TaxID=1300272 RepID=A0A2W7C789_9HYPH|nr:DUF5801 repeats-in-toxin domain-containing protein [Mesorhizobium kowhaii]PZV38975.1 hypothetical protein B5V02_02745 [Mesorhizobium kowhaii]